jgi:hypothetical protein
MATAVNAATGRFTVVSIAIGSEKDQPFLPRGAPDRKEPGAGNTEGVARCQHI